MDTTSVYYTFACTFCAKVRDVFKKFFSMVAEAQMRRAAFWQARHLIETNRDFRNCSVSELTNQIMDEMNPTHIDGSPVKTKV